LREAGLVASTTEAGRKIKEKAVHINGHLITNPAIIVCPKEPLLARVGKKMKKIVLTGY
jgi:tyrosyl-tRNA synthetase